MKKHRILSHSYRLVHHRISTKDVVLRKQFSGNLTTEQFLEIDQQPGDTCPMIDPVQTLIEAQMKPLEDIEKINLSDLHHSDHCDHCSNDEVYNKNLEAAESAKSDAESLREQLEEAKEYLEELRSDCENLRAHGLEIKSWIWSIPEIDDLDSIRDKIVDLIDSAPETKFSYKKYSSLFPEGDRVAKFNVESFDTCENEECCFNNKMLADMEELSEMLPTLCISEEDCSDAMDNYDKISEWVIYLGEKALELIDDENAVQKLKDKNDINAFVEEYQKDFDKSYTQSWSWMKEGELLTSLDKIEQEVKLLLLDYDQNNSLEYDLLKDILLQLKYNAELIEGTSIKSQLEAHQKMTKKIFDEISPKIEAVYEMAALPLKDWRLQQTHPKLYEYYTSLSKACSVVNSFKLLNFYSTYQIFAAEEY